MKAVTWTEKNRFALADVPECMIHDPHGVKVQVNCAAMSSYDKRLFAGDASLAAGGTYIAGDAMAGVVVELGEYARRSGIKLGDRVLGYPGRHCGVCIACQMGREYACINVKYSDGACAEYVVWDEAQLARVPGNVALPEAVLHIVLAKGIGALGRVGMMPGEAVAVLSANGIGLALLPLIRRTDAGTITVIDQSEERRALAEKLGADHTIDPSRQDIWEESAKLTRLKGFGTVFEASGDIDLINPVFYNLEKGGAMIFLADYGTHLENAFNLFHIVQNSITMIGVNDFSKQDLLRATSSAAGYSLQCLAETFPAAAANEAMERYVGEDGVFALLQFGTEQ